MNLLFDIGHPAHVHLLKHVIHNLKQRHKIFITVKDLPVAKKLLTSEGFDFIDLGTKKDGILGKAFNQLKYNIRLAQIVRKNKITLGIGTSITLPHVSCITKMKSIVLDDDDDAIQPLFTKYGHPFADIILTPNSIKRKSKKALYYAGTHELSYLHPKHFKPNPEVLKEIGISQNSIFFILRFVAFKGHHDTGHSGITDIQKTKLINLLIPYGQVFITSEKKLSNEFEKYRLPVAPEKILSLMYYATMFFGDSQTMTSEAALLATPALKCNSFAGQLSVPNEMENKYQLCYSFLPEQFDLLCNKATNLLQQKDIKAQWEIKRNKFLADKIDVSTFLTWFIENYPQSEKIMRTNPDYQHNFR